MKLTPSFRLLFGKAQHLVTYPGTWKNHVDLELVMSSSLIFLPIKSVAISLWSFSLANYYDRKESPEMGTEY